MVYGERQVYEPDQLKEINVNFYVYLPPSYAQLLFETVEYVNININSAKLIFESNNEGVYQNEINTNVYTTGRYSGSYINYSGTPHYAFDQHICAESQLVYHKRESDNVLYLSNFKPEIDIYVSNIKQSSKFKIEYYLKFYSANNGIQSLVWDNYGYDWFTIAINGRQSKININGPQNKRMTIPTDLYQIDLELQFVFTGIG